MQSHSWQRLDLSLPKAWWNEGGGHVIFEGECLCMFLGGLGGSVSYNALPFPFLFPPKHPFVP